MLKIVIGLRLLKYVSHCTSMRIAQFSGAPLVPIRSSSAWRKLRPKTTLAFFTGLALSFTYAACADAAEVQIISVEYRGPNKGRDFTASAIMNCNGKQICDFSCNNGTYADVDPGQLKICFIKYSCGNGPTLERTLLEKPDRYANLLDCRGK